jgi:hypothetical protein
LSVSGRIVRVLTLDICVALCFCAVASSQALPEAPERKPAIEQPHFNRRAFIAGVSLLAASKTADAV